MDIRSPIFAAIIKVVAYGPFHHAAFTCAPVSAGLAVAAGGSLGDAILAGALSLVQHGGGVNLWGQVGGILQDLQDSAIGLYLIAKPLAHGVVSGVLAVTQGGDFASGFAGGAVGAIGGIVSMSAFGTPGQAGDIKGFIGRTTIASVAGGTGSALAGGKFANGAVTAAFAHMYNAERFVIRMWLGTDAHQTLQGRLNHKDPRWTLESDLMRRFLGLGERPDLIGPDGDSIWELRPLGAAASAAAKIDRILAFNPSYHAGENSDIFSSGEPFTLNNTGMIFNNFGVRTSFTYYPVSPGVIGYTINNNTNQLITTISEAHRTPIILPGPGRGITAPR